MRLVTAKGKHLTYTDRLKLEALNNQGVPRDCIAAELGCSVRTVYYELKRGKCTVMKDYEFIQSYSADIAQQHIDYGNRSKGVPPKIGFRHDICDYISNRLLSGQSPAVIAHSLTMHDHGITLCTNTIYTYIRNGYIPNATIADTPEPRRAKPGRKKHIRPRRAAAGTSIEHRPAYINDRKEPGHWEMDCVIGKSTGRRQALLTLTERKTRYEIIMRLDHKDAKSVVHALDKLERQYGYKRFRLIFKSITVDNGCEFADCHGLEHSKNGKPRTKVYYCHPYCSSERGTNERHNRIIRRWLPKGQSLWSISQRDCDSLADWMNNYPRKVLDWATPAFLFGQAFDVETFYDVTAISS